MPKKEKKTKRQPQPKSLAIQRTQLSAFDDSYYYLKQKFAAEMRRMESEVYKFSQMLKSIYDGSGSSQKAVPQSSKEIAVTWETLGKSPLIHGEGNNRRLELKFDLSAFDPNDVNVEINDNILVVTARHVEASEGMKLLRDFRREVMLPHNVDHKTIETIISRDGVLTVQVPFNVEPIEQKVLKPSPIQKNPESVKPHERVLKKNPVPVSKNQEPLPGGTKEPKLSKALPASKISSLLSNSSHASPPTKISTQILSTQTNSKLSSKMASPKKIK